MATDTHASRFEALVRTAILLAPLLLVGSKITEVWLEGNAAERIATAVHRELAPTDASLAASRKATALRRTTLAPIVGYGVMRRLDDASFWTLVASMVASLSVFRTSDLILARPIPRQRDTMLRHTSDQRSSASNPLDASRARAWRAYVPGVAHPTPMVTLDAMCVLLFGALSAVYLRRTFVNDGTFFWWASRGFDLDRRELLIAAIQTVEGMIQLMMIGAVCWAAARALRATVAVRERSTASTRWSDATDFMNSLVSPYVIVFIAMSVFKALASQAGFVDEGSLWFGANVLGQLVFASLPLALAAVFAAIAWREKVVAVPRLGKEIVHIDLVPRREVASRTPRGGLRDGPRSGGRRRRKGIGRRA